MPNEMEWPESFTELEKLKAEELWGKLDNLLLNTYSILKGIENKNILKQFLSISFSIDSSDDDGDLSYILVSYLYAAHLITKEDYNDYKILRKKIDEADDNQDKSGDNQPDE